MDSPGKRYELSCQSPDHKDNRSQSKEIEQVPSDTRSHGARVFKYVCKVVNEREQLEQPLIRDRDIRWKRLEQGVDVSWEMLGENETNK